MKMELWVRSQDKKHLMKCEAIMYEETEIGYGLRAFTKNYDFDIGIYKTKERALEVLDEIQNILISKYMISLDYKNALGSNFTSKQIQEVLKETSVYQMPEK